MCQDCPSRRGRARAVAQELVADLLLPVVLWLVPVGLLVLSGHLEL